MTPNHHQRVLELFSTLYELPPDTWSSALDRECGDEPKLRREVEILLEKHRDPGPFLDTPALGDRFAIAMEATPDPGAAHVGAEIGQYRLTRLIARGGMGAVYEAEQRNPTRRVAIKLMRSDLFSRTAQRRFEYETQILSRLRHPGIAQIYEAGVWTEPGLPYFAMEFIDEARSIVRYAEEEHLSVRARIELFLEVCDAVSHGHRKGVIHRDLKPDNILIDGSGRPKIIDFGVACMTDADVALTTMQTGADDLVGTLAYMSPEQCGADPHDLDVRADVYSLGAVLYQLLCGRPPIDLRGVRIPRAVELLMQGVPPRPGTISEQCTGDLEAIVLKAIERERDRRYSTTLELAQDLHRYLAFEPVTARPPTGSYQLRMFVRRNRALVGGLVTALVAMMAGTGLAIWQAFIAEGAREEAVEALAVAERETAIKTSVYEFMHEMLTDFTGAEQEMTAREMLDRAATTIETHYHDEPIVEADVRDMIQAMYMNLGRYDLAEPHARRMLELYRGEYGPEHERTIWGLNRLGLILEHLDRIEEAEELQQSAYDTALRMYGPEHWQTFQEKNNLAMNWWAQGRLEEAEAWVRELVESYRRFPEREDEVLATYLNNLALLMDNQGHPEQAVPVYREVLELQQNAPNATDENIGRTLWNLSISLYNIGEVAEATEVIIECLELRRDHLGDLHPGTRRAFNWATTLYEVEENYDSAIALYETFLPIQVGEYGEESAIVAETMHHFGDTLYKAGEQQRGRELVARGLEIYLALPDSPPHEFRHTVEILNDMMEEAGETPEERLAMLRPAYEYQRANVPVDHLELILIPKLLGDALLEIGAADEAEPPLAQALQTAEIHWPSGHEFNWMTEVIRSRRGEALTKLGRLDEAEPLLIAAFERLHELKGDSDPKTQAALRRVIDLYTQRGDDAAVARYEALVVDEQEDPEPASTAEP